MTLRQPLFLLLLLLLPAMALVWRRRGPQLARPRWPSAWRWWR
ncbi:hypothetical protein [Kouleothrix sp.]